MLFWKQIHMGNLKSMMVNILETKGPNYNPKPNYLSQSANTIHMCTAILCLAAGMMLGAPVLNKRALCASCNMWAITDSDSSWEKQ